MLRVPATHAWCVEAAASAEQLHAAAQGGQLQQLLPLPVMRWPADELLLPALGFSFVTVALPYLQLALAAHCSGDERLAAALWQQQPWDAVARLWRDT